MEQSKLSPVLIRTWFNNLQGDSAEAKARAKEMLFETFGSEEKIMNYFVEQGWVKRQQN